MTAESPELGRINWFNLVWSALALLIMAAVIKWGDLHALNFLHVFAGLLWTGIDLYMGFVIGPALRGVPFEARRAVLTRITPKTLFILPVLAIVTSTTGWHLAERMGYLAVAWPAYWWIVASLAIVAVLTIQGLCILLPTQLRVYYELVRPTPDQERIRRLTGWYFWLIASQGIMQIAIVVIMTRLRMGI